MALGGTLGLELLRTTGVLLDVQVRGYAAFGSADRGLRPILQPGLGLNFAF